MSEQPFVLMIAGPNGSGKTTLTNMLRSRNIDFGEYINPDDIAVGLIGSYQERVLLAQQIADQRREESIKQSRSFSFETVMSHESKLDILKKAKSAGFFVQIFFVGIDNPEVNVERVASRVAQGGHDVPSDRIVNRWQRSMELLCPAVLIADKSFIFDNSSTDGPRSVLNITDYRLLVYQKLRADEMPRWVQTYLLDRLKKFAVIDTF